MIVVVCSVFVTNKKSVLLVRESKAVTRDKFGFPGGKLEAGENLEACAIRECKEETGFDVVLGRLLMISQKPRTHEDNTVIKFIYEAQIKHDNSQIAKAELEHMFMNQESFSDLIKQSGVRGKDVIWLLKRFFSDGLPDSTVIKTFV